MATPADDDRTTSFTPLTAGTEIGSYRLVRELGIGGMGQVFLAEDSRLDRRVALKFLAPTLYVKPEFRQRFTREAKSAAKLNHNNIITIYDVGETPERAYIAMEYIDGRTLRQLIDTRALDYDIALAIIEQLCNGLKTAHDNGIIHRDLKPANIMVTESNQVKILDFGLAKGGVDGDLTATGTAMGTVNYMSPEQTQGAATDHRTDIFSIGILLFELATGVNPFVRGHMPATIHAIVYEPIGQISAYNGKLSPSWQIIVEKALGKKPEDRYQSIGELLEDIERLKRGETITPAAVAQPNVARSDVPSLAVLHLKNLGSEEDEFLTYGITEDLIVDLSKLGNLRVVPMRRILKYKDSDLELEDLARNLNANLILDGSIRRSSSAVRISVQLVDVGQDEILWSERWEQSFDSLPAIKSALAEGISSALDVNSSVIRKADIAKKETSNPEAYDLYLKGKYAYHNRKKKQDVLDAIEYYNRALSLEPDMLAAKVGLAEIHAMRQENEQATQILVPALEEAERLNLKADQARVRTVLGIVANRTTEFKASVNHLKRAAELYRELNDLNGEAHAISELSKPLANAGLYDEAFEIEKRMGQLIEQGVDPAYVAEWLLVFNSIHTGLSDSQKALSTVEEAVQLARAHDLKPLLCKALVRLAGRYSGGDGKQLQIAMSYVEEARMIAERLDEQLLISTVEFFGLTVEFALGALRRTAESIKRLLPIWEQDKNDIGLASMMSNLVLLMYELGDFKRAKELEPEFERIVAAVIADPIRQMFRIDQINVLGYGLFWNGQREQGMMKWQEGYRLAMEYEHGWGAMIAARYLGEGYMIEGDQSAAVPYLERAAKLGIEMKELEMEVAASGYLSLIGAMEGKLDEGRIKLKLLIDRAEGTLCEVIARRIYGMMLLEQSDDSKDHQEGRQQLLRALALARTMEWAIEKNRISELLEKHS